MPLPFLVYIISYILLSVKANYHVTLVKTKKLKKLLKYIAGCGTITVPHFSITI